MSDFLPRPLSLVRPIIELAKGAHESWPRCRAVDPVGVCAASHPTRRAAVLVRLETQAHEGSQRPINLGAELIQLVELSCDLT